MSDVWSLKGKVASFGGYVWYQVGDIETLREKLIEDIKQISNQKQYLSLRGSLIYKEILETINKRFGVK